MTKEPRTKLCLPRIKKVKLSSFSLYSLEPEIDIDFPEGVFCLAGANGLGKSTFLLALNYAITGIVPEPGRSFPSVEEYYRFCQEFTREFFSGRVKEEDREIASVHVEFIAGDSTFRVTRDFFNPTQLLDLSITDGNGTNRTSSDRSPSQLHQYYTEELPRAVGVQTFEQVAFLQHFVLTFDERRHLLFWNARELEQAIYIAFGVDNTQANRAEKLRRDIERAESRARNYNYQATQIGNEIKNLEKSSRPADSDDIDDDIVDEHKRLIAESEKASQQSEILADQFSDTAARLAELSAEQASLRADYAQAFAKRVAGTSDLLKHPVVAASLRESKCQLCGVASESIDTEIKARVVASECPLCGSQLKKRGGDPALAGRLQRIDKGLARVTDALNDVVAKRDRLNKNLQQAISHRDKAAKQLEVFEKRNARTIASLHQSGGSSINAVLKKYREQAEEFLRKKKEELQRRDDYKKELRPLQRALQNRYGEIEGDFVPKFNSFASSFLGIDLDLQLEIKGSTGVGLTVDVEGSRRRAQFQLSESQRFFIDIALRMALVKFMSQDGHPACLYIDTPEGSLDIAYETTAGRMFGQFIDNGFGITMTANINSSRLLLSLAETCGSKRMVLHRMTGWTELSDVQRREDKLFDQAFEGIEKALAQSGKAKRR